MRVIIQRVLEASVTIDGNCISQIGKGYLLLVGVTHDDTMADVEYLSRKIANMRLFEDEQGKMNHGIQEVEGEILSVSQFTLYADTKKGNRPSFTHAATPALATELYDALNQSLNASGIPVQTGRFGADMKVSLVNDGPVTIVVDSQQR